MSHQHNAHRWQFTEGRVAKRSSEHAAAKRIVAGSTFAVLAGLTLALGIAPAQAQADTADNDVQLTTPGKLPSATASFDQSAGYFIWPYQFGYQNVSKANPKGTVPGTDTPATAPSAGEYGWAAPGYRDYDACMASLDAQIKQVKESGFQYVTVSYLISPLNAKQKADGSWGDPNKQGDMEPDTRLNDAIINRVLDAGLKPVVYFSQGNPDKRLADNPVAAFTMDQIRATIEHAIKTFAGRGIIWESWNEPDSAGWTSGMTAENKPHWIALDQFIGDCVDKYDKGADYVYGNFATPANNNQVADDVLAKAHATARSGHGYGGGTPESGTKPNLNTKLSAYMDSEFGVPSSGRIHWAANNWGDWGDKDDAHPEEGYLATEQDAETQAAWLGRQLLMKDISGTNLSTIYRLVGYDSFSVNDNADGANPSVIKTTPAYEQVKYLGNQLKGYTFEKLLPVDGKEYDGKVDGVETDYTTDADTKKPNEFRVYAAVYKNAAGNEKLVYWHGGRTGVNASTSPYVTDKSVTKDFTVKFGGKDLKLTSTSWAHVYGTAKATDTTLSTAVGTAPMLPDTVELTWPDGIKTNETVAWDKVDASAYAKKGTFTVKGTVSGVSVTATVNVVTQTSLTNTSIWKDEDGNAIQAHGGSIVQAKDGTFYWVGQGAPDNVPTGEKGVFANQWLYTTINMYKSKDLTNWQAVNPVASIDDEDAKLYARGNVEGSTSTVLKYTNADGTAAKGFEQLLKEHPQYATDAALGCKIERPHIIYNAKTDRYVVWAHWEGTVGYGSSQLIVFQSEGSDPTGPYHPVSWGKDAQGNDIYHAQPTVTIDGKQTAVPSRDLTAWADPDTGEAYVISVFAGKGLRLYKLDDTYTKILTEGSYSFMTDANIEAPSLFKENGRYYMLTSRQDYWDPTQTEYASTTNLADPKAWSGLTEIQSRDEARKNWGGDASTRTYLGQPTYVLQYKDAKGKAAVMLMADDWNPKKAATANVDTTIANYVWSSVDVDDETGAANVDYHQVVNPMKPAENGTLSGFSYEYRKDAGNYPETFVGAGYYVTGYTGSAANATLPATINGKPVVGALLDRDAQNAKLTAIDTSKAANLGIFRVSAAYKVKSLDFTANKKLQKLDVSDTSTPASELSSVKLGGLPELTYVDLGFHEGLKELDVSGSPKLAHLDVSNTGIKSLDLTKNPLLKREAGNVSADNDVTIDFDETRTVTFESNGGSAVAPAKVTDGQKVAKPADPKRAGYTFAGWFSDRALTRAYDFAAPVTGDVTLYAKWAVKSYTVTFDADGGSAVAAAKVEYGKAAAKPADPKRSGYTFGGWYSDAALTRAYDFASPVKADATLYAKWVPVAPKVFTVAFDSNGGSAVASAKVTDGQKVAEPADPMRSGYTFAGWYSDAALTKPYDFKAAVKADVTLYAKWTKNPAPQPKTYTVSFNSNGGSAVAAQKVTEGKVAAKPADPKRSGYTFAGWYADAKLTRAYDFKAAVKADVTLYAKWAKNPTPQPKTYTVSFNSNGGSAVAAQKVTEGKAAAKPADPTRSGYTFGGWYSDSKLTKAYDFGAAVKADVTLYANWTKNPAPQPKVHTVAFNANGGSAVAPAKVTDGQKVAKPADPKRAGYTFAGWFTDQALTKAYDFKAAVSGDVTLYAKWTKNAVPTPQPKTYTVSFNSNGGSAVAAQKVTEGKVAAKPADPKRAGYTFGGWYSDAALTKPYDFASPVKADVTLYAKWTQAPQPSEQFKDVTGASHWVKDEGYLDYSVEHGLMTGYKNEATQQLNGLFGPTDKITRGQVAVVLFRIANPTDDSTTNPAHYGSTTGFSDQGAFPYYKSAIKWLKDKGVLTGDKDPVTQADLNTVRPDAPITRQELATMVARFASNVRGVDVSHADVSQLGKFTDGKQVMPFAQKAMAWCYQAGVFTGGQAADAGKLMPLNNTQRDQACKVFTVLHRDVLKLK